MIAEIAHFSLVIGTVMALLLSLLPIWGSYRSEPLLADLAKPLAFGQFLFVLMSFLLLVYLFTLDDFSVKYVANNSNTQLPFIYKISATWGAHEGSLLLWALILTVWTVAAAFFSHVLSDSLRTRMLSVLGMVSFGFLLFILFTSNPFERLLDVPIQGRSLNPLLQDIGLAIHPPMLYVGYVGLAVSFAFAVGVLLEGKFESVWASWAKNWTIVAWAFLTLGIALGSWWAYYELGWGGWWFWDPVENASLLPWIVATALIHSLGMTAKRGSFQSWSVLLAVLAFSLSLLGTFLVRSGVLTSVHAFASDPSRGVFILLFLALVVGVSLWLFSVRGHLLSNRKPFKLVSKDAFLLFNNVILMVMMLTVLLGTIYPLILDALGIAKLSVGAPYFNTVMLPLTLVLTLFMGFGFFAMWREDNFKRLLIKLRTPLALSLVLSFIIPLFIFEQLNFLAVIGLFMSLWVGLSALQWVWLGQRQGLDFKVAGSGLAHFGFAVCLAGMTMVSLNSVEKDIRLEPNESYVVKDYRFEFKGVVKKQGPNYLASEGTVLVYYKGVLINTLKPQKRTYLSQTMPMTEAGIDAALSRDLFVALGEPLEGINGDVLNKVSAEGAWSLRVQYKPMIRWIWLGAILMALGGLLTLFARSPVHQKLAAKSE